MVPVLMFTREKKENINNEFIGAMSQAPFQCSSSLWLHEILTQPSHQSANRQKDKAAENTDSLHPEEGKKDRERVCAHV